MQIWVVMEEGCGDGNSPEQVFSSVEAAEAAASKGSRLYVCGPFTLDQASLVLCELFECILLGSLAAWRLAK